MCELLLNKALSTKAALHQQAAGRAAPRGGDEAVRDRVPVRVEQVERGKVRAEGKREGDDATLVARWLDR